MKKINIIYICLVYVLLFSMCSCGARKVNKEHSKEEIKTESVDNSVIEKQTDTNVKTTTIVKVDDKNETVTEETTISPADNTKEAFIIEKDGTKVVLNNTKKVYKKTTQKNNSSTSANIAQVQIENKASKEKKNIEQKEVSTKEVKAKQVDKKQFNPFVLIMTGIGVLVLLYVIYILYKKFMFP